jgi:hypothetical protein
LTPVKRAYIRSVVDTLDFELVRYMVIERSTNAVSWVRSSRFLIDRNDVIRLQFSWRTKTKASIDNNSGNAFGTANILLYGDDGTFWSLRSANDGATDAAGREWVQCNANFERLDGAPNHDISTPFISDTTSWTSVQVNYNQGVALAKTPVPGSIEVLFLCKGSGIAAGNESWFKDIQIEYVSFLQGSYVPLKGDFNYLASNNDIKQTYSEDVEISDSPKRYFKGALLDIDEKQLLKPNWIRRDYPSDKPMRFTQAMGRIIFNNIGRQLEKIEGTFRGVTYVDPTDLGTVHNVGFLNSYYFSMHPEPTKKFILTSYEIDYATGSGRRVFVEMCKDVNDDCWRDPADAAVGTYKFQYVFQ